MLTQVDLIRGRSLRLLQQLSIYISCLPTREQTALERLSGVEGQKTFARIADYILLQLGHEEPQGQEQNRRSYRDSKEYVSTVIVGFDQPKQKGWPKGKPRKPKEQESVATQQDTLVG